jgi:DNA segregation ATPase FtsK/SpoIIIE, S-DNA-T family
MTEPLLISRQRTALHELYQAVEDRARTEPIVEMNFKARNEATEKTFQETTLRLITRFEAEKNAAQKEFEETQQRVALRFQQEKTAQDKEIQDTRKRLTRQAEEAREKVQAEFQETRWTIATVFEAAKNKADEQLRGEQNTVADALQQAKAIHKSTVKLLKDWRQYREHDKVPPTANPDRIYKDAFKQLDEAVDQAEEHRAKLNELRLPGLFQGKRPVWLFLLPLLLAAGIAVLVTGTADIETLLYGQAGAVIAACVIGFGASLWLYSTATRHIKAVYEPLCRSLSDLEVAAERARAQAKEAHEGAHAKAQKRHDRDLEAAKQKLTEQLAAIKQRHDTAWKQASDKYRQARADSTQRRDTDLHQAHEKYQRLRTEIFSWYETESQQAHQTHFRQMTESRQRYEEEWNAMASAWQERTAQVNATVNDVNAESGRLFPAWDSPVWNNWTPPEAIPPGIPFGTYRVSLADIPDGVPKDARLKPVLPEQFTLPALSTFPNRCSLLFKGSDEGRAQAVQALQDVMLRFLTAIPPSKVRFTILDPVGLGENFAAFMHLADYDEQLVNSRIWTEMPHIEQRLSDLTGHMENVIQKYLRNQFESIEDYNAMAGEVAEPYRILVVANFPAGFSNDAARRLVSIANSGPRCGVYVLVTVDTKLDLPQGFNLGDLEQCCVNLHWKEGRFEWLDPDFGRWPLRLEAPPPADFATRVLNVVGAKAREAARVEVPFEFIAAPREQWWTGDSRGGINVPLGRAGATKRQHFKLGQGTSQHALVAGKTGSGKSTLMHALITNLALIYSPDEVELYLIDFKKGVEFKTYATQELPHARVVAIESEREFGLSVLQRLDAELRLRGEKFRDAGAQDLAGYRQATGQTLPRILLVVDEFQEFFTDDDKIAQDCAQLLDRLVRQGRAFGLHVLLGSQTLGGAYSLARSTIDQMAVRIALQCSEADAHLILSDENSAARLLSRPGEAIYNDANGLVEGNNPFQVVWLPESRREEYLRTVRDMDRKRNGHAARPQIVFEGNAPADVNKNHLLHNLLAAPQWPGGVRAYHAWLGEAVAIKDPTTAVFRPQSGSNLLLIGQQEDSALGILGTALISLAAQHVPPDGDSRGASARFYVLDGSPVDSPHAGKLGRLADVVPHPVQVVGWRELPGVLAELTEEVDRRQKAPENDAPSLYLLVYGLHRFRDLRKSDDDYGFSREEKPTPSKQFATLLREGPSFRIHTLAWCDNLNNLTRTLDRQAMREFELRVLFQMSTADSSNLIDTPAASKLGLHRALYHSEEEGRLEKFRPYGWPTDEWLAWVRGQLQGRTVPVG